MLIDRERILQRIKPSEAETKRDLALAKQVISFIRDQFGLEAVLVGSVARGTALKGKKDLDIFILFDKKTSMKELEKIGEKVGREVAKKLGGVAEKHYAQHPYIRIILKNRRIEIVPAYKIQKGERILSAVDRTPLHNEFVKSKLKNPDDALLLKWFMKQIGVYGAEIKTRGFSGYLCELLVIAYGSFERVIEEASVWEPPIIVDIENQYDSIDEIKQTFCDPLVVIDPVDKSRNVAAPVSIKRLSQFILASKMLIDKKKLPKKSERNTKDKNILVIRWKIKEVNEEVIWSQLESFARRIKDTLEIKGFSVKEIMWWTDAEKSAEILIDLDSWQLSKIEKRRGPYAYDIRNVPNFIDKYKKVLVGEDGRLYAERVRGHWTAKDSIKEILKSSPKYLGNDYKFVSPGKSKIIKMYKKSLWSW